jgi:hypothetical protein
MHLLNEVMLHFRHFLDSLGHVVQFLQHGFLARREPMHPPKTDDPASRADPGKKEAYHLDIEAHIQSGALIASLLAKAK